MHWEIFLCSGKYCRALGNIVVHRETLLCTIKLWSTCKKYFRALRMWVTVDHKFGWIHLNIMRRGKQQKMPSNRQNIPICKKQTNFPRNRPRSLRRLSHCGLSTLRCVTSCKRLYSERHLFMGKAPEDDAAVNNRFLPSQTASLWMKVVLIKLKWHQYRRYNFCGGPNSYFNVMGFKTESI